MPHMFVTLFRANKNEIDFEVLVSQEVANKHRTEYGESLNINIGDSTYTYFNEEDFCRYWVEDTYEPETYCEIILDIVVDEQDPESINYTNAYMYFNQIQMTMINEQGPAGGNPQILYRGARADLERMIHDLFEDDNLAAMITQL